MRSPMSSNTATTASDVTVRMAITPDSALLISDFLEIPDMRSWADALGMQDVFEAKMSNAERMRSLLYQMHCLDSTVVRILHKTHFQLTFGTLQRLSSCMESGTRVTTSRVTSSSHDRDAMARTCFFMKHTIKEYSRGTSDLRMARLMDGGRLALQPGSLNESSFARPLTRQISDMLEESSCFLFCCDLNNLDAFMSQFIMALSWLLNAIPVEKRLIVCCPEPENRGNFPHLLDRIRHQTLLRTFLQLRHFPQNLEFHSVKVPVRLEIVHDNISKLALYQYMCDSCRLCV